jgi:hypothetical protein
VRATFRQFAIGCTLDSGERLQHIEMRFASAIAAALVLGLSGCDDNAQTVSIRVADPAARYVIVLSSTDRAHLGLETAPALPATFTPHVRGYGVVLNFSTLAQYVANVDAAEAAARESSAVLDDVRALYGKGRTGHAMSREALDAAIHRATTDAAQAELAHRQEDATFGRDAPWLSAEEHDAILAALSSGRTVLVQATFPLGSSFRLKPGTLSLTHLNTQSSETAWTTASIWEAPADPSMPGRSYYGLVEGSDLAQGEHVLVVAPTGSPLTGVLVPSESVVLSEDKAWCYVFRAPNTFQRLPIDPNRTLAGGYFVEKGIGVNEPVVIKGASLLLARELGLALSAPD